MLARGAGGVTTTRGAGGETTTAGGAGGVTVTRTCAKAALEITSDPMINTFFMSVLSWALDAPSGNRILLHSSAASLCSCDLRYGGAARLRGSDALCDGATPRT